MQENTAGQGISRREFLKGLGALALLAVPACRRAQQFAIQPEDCPEWMLPGEATCFATCMPWASGAIPMLAVCHEGVPVSLQPNPHYTAPRKGLPAFAQAAILDLYDEARSATPTRAGKPHPMAAFLASLRAWSTLLQEGRNIAFLFPCGYSAVRMAQVAELRRHAGASFYEYDTAAHARPTGFAELEVLQKAAFGEAVKFNTGFGSIQQLTQALPSLDVLFIFTPADPAAFDADFAAALANCTAETIRFLPRQADKTAHLCLYTVPQTHFLEEWGAEADAHGNLCLRQPVTQKLRPALAEAEVLHALLHHGEYSETTSHSVSMARRWVEKIMPDCDRVLKRGIAPGGAPLPASIPAPSAPQPALYLHPFYADGRFRHNRWLRETYLPLSGHAGEPEAFTPGSGAPGGVSIGGRTLPAWGHKGLKSIWLPLLPETAHLRASDIHPAACPQSTYLPAKEQPPQRRGSPSLKGGKSPQWAMIIDLKKCIGCGACTIACRAENNIPTVGSEDMRYGRDLQWLRIRRYLDADKKLHFVPSACRHCEQAPCEAVCPVNATQHSSSGLNTMVYPRCWGTRYCAAACPYHARVFNFRDYSKQLTHAAAKPHNPQVTVRTRGVMEKCTYCVQRINAAANTGSGTPQTACQQVCPTGAITLINLAETPPPREVITAYDTAGTQPRTLFI